MEMKVKWWVAFLVAAVFVLSVYVDRCLQRIIRTERGLQQVEFHIHYYLPDLPENCRVCHVPGKEDSRWKLVRTEK